MSDKEPFNWTSHDEPNNILGDLDISNNTTRAEDSFQVDHPLQQTNVLHDIFHYLSNVELLSYPQQTTSLSTEVNDFPESSQRRDKEDPEKEPPHQIHRHAKGKQVGESKVNHLATKRINEHKRRARIHAKILALQKIVPGCHKRDQASILDAALNHIKSLKHQIDMTSMMMGAGYGLAGAGKAPLPIGASPSSGYALMIPPAFPAAMQPPPPPPSPPRPQPFHPPYQSLVCPLFQFSATAPPVAPAPFILAQQPPAQPPGSSSDQVPKSQPPSPSQ